MWKAPLGYQILGVSDAHTEQNKPTYGGPKRIRQLVMGLGILVVGVWLTWYLILLTGWDQFTPQAGYTSRTAWPDVRYLFILLIFCSEADSSGDSYTTVEYDVTREHPNEQNPIGNPEFPGRTWSPGANWVALFGVFWLEVGYLITEHNQSVILAHDFAVGGYVVQGVEREVHEWFLPYAGRQPDWAPWESDNSIFSMFPLCPLTLVTWIGINDINRNIDPYSQLSLLFDLQDQLYDAGARNFIFINVPPWDRAPLVGISHMLSANWEKPDTERAQIKAGIAKWNTQLNEFTLTFRYRHPDTSVSIYDSFSLFNEVMDNPTKHGFTDGSSECHSNTCFWYDNMHPTTRVHEIMAQDMAKFIIADWLSIDKDSGVLTGSKFRYV
jgi:hypothetical protein